MNKPRRYWRSQWARYVQAAQSEGAAGWIAAHGNGKHGEEARMNADRELDDILSEIGREHRAIGAPESLEPLLFAASASRIRDTRQRRMRLTWALATAAILLAVVAAGGSSGRRGEVIHGKLNKRSLCLHARWTGVKACSGTRPRTPEVCAEICAVTQDWASARQPS